MYIFCLCLSFLSPFFDGRDFSSLSKDNAYQNNKLVSFCFFLTLMNFLLTCNTWPAIIFDCWPPSAFSLCLLLSLSSPAGLRGRGGRAGHPGAAGSQRHGRQGAGLLERHHLPLLALLLLQQEVFRWVQFVAQLWRRLIVQQIHSSISFRCERCSWSFFFLWSTVLMRFFHQNLRTLHCIFLQGPRPHPDSPQFSKVTVRNYSISRNRIEAKKSLSCCEVLFYHRVHKRT